MLFMCNRKGLVRMTKKEADKIIKSYIPHKGFFDLSKQPKGLSNIEYAKTLDTQNFLARMNKDKDYLLEFNPTQWDRLKEVSTKLQRIIFDYWGDMGNLS